MRSKKRIISLLIRSGNVRVASEFKYKVASPSYFYEGRSYTFDLRREWDGDLFTYNIVYECLVKNLYDVHVEVTDKFGRFLDKKLGARNHRTKLFITHSREDWPEG